MIKSLTLYFIFLLITGCSSVIQETRQFRIQYKSEFLKDPRSPLKEEDLQKLDFFPPSSKARVTAVFLKTPDAKPFEMATYSGQMRNYRKWGVATFHWRNNMATVAIYENLSLVSNPEYKDYLFLPFKDETNGVSTYGGGRYLDMSRADTEDGSITIDFNKCYNPWCAFSDGFNCPIPPTENNLHFSIRAGEKNYRGTHIALGH